jgi:hypothetical protein
VEGRGGKGRGEFVVCCHGFTGWRLNGVNAVLWHGM